MRRRSSFLALFLFTAVSFSLFAQSPSDAQGPGLKLDVPLFDLPYQIDAMNTTGHGFFRSYANPSMAQSLAVTEDLISTFHFGMKVLYDKVPLPRVPKNILYAGGTAALDFLITYLPGGDGWLHEEYHRAVMTRFEINSFNGMNLFPIGAELVKVSQVEDDDLIRLKRESPADFIRMHEAGIEGQYVLVNKLQRNNFFYNQNMLHEISYWLSTLNSHLYVINSANVDGVDAQTVKMIEEEKDMASRDFTGFDMTAWVYDLFKPREPYEERGTHPSGNGINRYRVTTDLTGEELEYLRLQGYLQALNYVSPMMFGVRRIAFGESGFAGNFAMRHYLTSFGYDIAAQAFLKYQEINLVFGLHNYLNYKNYFPSIETELIDFPFTVGRLGMYISPRVLFGIQPKDQRFKTNEPEFFGALGLRIDFILTKHVLPYVDFNVKTDGWLAGNEYLNHNASFKTGVSIRF